VGRKFIIFWLVINSMSQSVTDTLTHAWEQTAPPSSECQRALLTDITLLDLQENDLPSRLVLTAMVSDGPELVWEFSLPDNDEEMEALFSCLPSVTERDAALDVSQADEPIWVRQATDADESVAVTSARWDRSGEWLLVSLDAPQQQFGLIDRWGRVLATAVLLCDERLGVWRIVLQLGVLVGLALVVEPAWPIVLAGLLILASEEVALNAFR
jgi:hypothetical protein